MMKYEDSDREDGDILVKCKYSDWKLMNISSKCIRPIGFICIGLSCTVNVYVSWIFYLMNKQHLIEVKDE